MNKLQLIACVFTVCTIGLIEVIRGDNNVEQPWKTIHYTVFTNQGAPLGPKNTHELLKQLMQIYTDSADPADRERQERVEYLLEACRPSGNKCNREFFGELNKLMNYNSPYKVNILPYLHQCKEDQFSACKDVLAANLRDVVASSFTDRERQNINEIREGVVTTEAENLFLGFNRKHLAEALLAFIEAHKQEPWDAKLIASKRHGRNQFNQLFVDSIGHLCGVIHRGLKEQLELFDLMTDNSKSSTGFDWITNGRICRYIVLNLDSVADDTLTLLRSRIAPKTSLMDKLHLPCMHATKKVEE